jgi:hypothetical protein
MREQVSSKQPLLKAWTASVSGWYNDPQREAVKYSGICVSGACAIFSLAAAAIFTDNLLVAVSSVFAGAIIGVAVTEISCGVAALALKTVNQYRTNRLN